MEKLCSYAEVLEHGQHERDVLIGEDRVAVEGLDGGVEPGEDVLHGLPGETAGTTTGGFSPGRKRCASSRRSRGVEDAGRPKHVGGASFRRESRTEYIKAVLSSRGLEYPDRRRKEGGTDWNLDKTR